MQYIIQYILTIYIVAFQETFNVFELSKAKSFLAYIDNFQVLVVQAGNGFLGEVAVVTCYSFFNHTYIGVPNVFQLFFAKFTYEFFLGKRLLTSHPFMSWGMEDLVCLI